MHFTGSVIGPKKLSVTVDQYVSGKEKDAEDLVLIPNPGLRNTATASEIPWVFCGRSSMNGRSNCSRATVVPVVLSDAFDDSTTLILDMGEARRPFRLDAVLPRC